jgi:hypothetical protein
LLAVIVARVFGARVVGEIDTAGGLDESTLKLPATSMTFPSIAQTRNVLRAVPDGQRNQPLKLPPLSVPSWESDTIEQLELTS